LKGIHVEPTIISGSGNPALAQAIAASLNLPLTRRRISRSPDGELRVEIEDTVRARDVYVVQPTGPPLDENLMELLFLADACRRSGALHVTAVVPYFGYARQDRSIAGQQALGARLVPDLMRVAGVGRVVAVDLHTTAVETAFGIAVEHLSAVRTICKAIAAAPPDAVVVAADMGALRMAERYAHLLGLPLAIVAKVRISDDKVVARNVIGEVRNRRPIIVDDMIITGATVEAALNAVVGLGAIPEAIVAAIHGLMVGAAAERLLALPIRRMLVTDSVPAPSNLTIPLEVVSLAPLLGQVISRLHVGERLGDLIDGN
jgi:ribose-phosphate pyrophosphokinase